MVTTIKQVKLEPRDKEIKRAHDTNDLAQIKERYNKGEFYESDMLWLIEMVEYLIDRLIFSENSRFREG